MKKFLIHCSTSWCGEEVTYAALAESELDLEELADGLAHDNLHSYFGSDESIAEAEGYTPDEMTEEDWAEMWENCCECDYYSYFIEEFEGDENDWQSYGEPYTI